jgi:hypothetical protein
MVKRALAGILIVAAAFAVACAHRALAAEDVLKGYEALQSRNGPFVVLHPPHLARMARDIDRLLEESAAGIARSLGLETIGTIRVILAPDAKTYGLLHQGAIPEWGIAFSDLNTQVLGINVDLVVRNPRPLSTVVRHELSHLLLAQRVSGAVVPAWFMEGLAVMQAGEWSFSDEWRLMTLAGGRDVPYLETLKGPFPRGAEEAALCYGVSYLAVSKLLRESPGSLLALTAFLRDSGDFESAFASTYGMSTYDFGGKLYVEIERRYGTAGTILNASPYWGGFALFFVSVFLVKRARSRRKLKRWEEEARERSFWY